jgi:hypothetical protein
MSLEVNLLSSQAAILSKVFQDPAMPLSCRCHASVMQCHADPLRFELQSAKKLEEKVPILCPQRGHILEEVFKFIF